MTTNIPAGSLENNKISLKEQIETITADLMYPSESDEKIDYFEMELSTTDKLSMADFRLFNGIKPETVITEISLDDFFKPLIKIEDWFGEKEKKWAEDGLSLKNQLLEKARDFQIFKVGSVEIDVYIFGKTEECKWVGLKTKVVET
jgi:hypothetical protein